MTGTGASCGGSEDRGCAVNETGLLGDTVSRQGHEVGMYGGGGRSKGRQPWAWQTGWRLWHPSGGRLPHPLRMEWQTLSSDLCVPCETEKYMWPAVLPAAVGCSASQERAAGGWPGGGRSWHHY